MTHTSSNGRQMPLWGWVAPFIRGPAPNVTHPTTTTTAPAALPTPDQFHVDVVVTSKNCSGPAACSFTYLIRPRYTGPEPLKATSFTVAYQVNGGLAPQVGNFTVTNGAASVDRSSQVDTDSEDAVLTATATQVTPD
jgi:hypothetical protein